MKMPVNEAQYNVAAPGSFPEKVAHYQRRRMYDFFIKTCNPLPSDILLDVGATSDRAYEASNYLEAWYPYKDHVVAAGIDDAGFLEEKYPGMKFVCANGLDLPFGNSDFDIVHSSAVIEHVGSFSNQTRFIAELARVARKRVFLTTPNRWFPIEFHTVLPLVHWLPKEKFRSILKVMNKEFFSREENLNLMSAQDVRNACIAAGIENFKVNAMPLCGWPANLLIEIRKL